MRKRGSDGDVDFLREALRVLVEGIMDAEVSARIGAEYGERTPERVTQRNGYRSRAWDTRVGTMELRIPKLREGSYFPSLLEPRRRSERALLAVIQQAYVEGVSTRRVDDLVKALGCEGISKSQMRQFHRIIREQADQMQGLITDLLDVARIDAGTLAVAPESSDVAVLVDRRRIVQVLGNLLSNAARHSPEGYPIRVDAAPSGIQVEISVSDDGAGIAAERLPHLFRRFSRPGAEGPARETVGSGLGLAICKGIVEAHGGRIWAESDGLGLGSRFAFTLPASAETALPARPASRSGGRAAQEVRILTVDDDPQTLRYVRDVLSEAGYVPQMTGDPEAVGRLIREEKPHLVLLDLMLPGTDGVELMERFPELAEVPVIFLSAYGRDQVIARALEAGADDYIVKPFSPTELVARIQTVLRRRAPVERPEPSEPYVLGDLTVNFAERRVSMAGRPVRLTGMEYRVLAELAANAGWVVTHADLLLRVWGPAHAGGSGPVRTIVKNLRDKLGEDAENPTYIFNEPRIGSRLGEGRDG